MRALQKDEVGKRLEAAFAGDHRAGAALGAVGQVEILEGRTGGAGEDLGLEFVGEFALLDDGGEDGFATGLQFAMVGQALLDGANLHLIEVAVDLLAVARDEGDGTPFAQQFSHGSNLPGGDVQLGANAFAEVGRAIQRAGVKGHNEKPAQKKRRREAGQ